MTKKSYKNTLFKEKTFGQKNYKLFIFIFIQLFLFRTNLSETVTLRKIWEWHQKGNFFDYSIRYHWWFVRGTQCEGGAIIPFFVYCNRNPELFVATVGFLSLPFASTNLYIIHKTLTYPCIDKWKCKTHPRYRAIIERFQKRSIVM